MKNMNSLMIKIVNVFVLLIIITFSHESFAQEKTKYEFSLIEAIDYALENNYDALNSKLDVEAANKKLNEIIASGFPQISGSVEYNNFFEIPTQLLPGDFFDKPGEFIPVKFGVRHNASAGVTVTQLIFSGSYIVGVQASNVYLDLTEQNNRRSEMDVAQTVTQTYYLVLLVEENKKILQRSFENLMKILYEVNESFKEGFVEETEVKQLQISVTQLENSLITLSQQIDVSYNLLKLQMGIDLEKKVVLTDKLEDIVQYANISSLISSEFDLNKNVEFQLLQSQEKLSGLSLRNEWSKFLPTIAAFGTYQYNAQRNRFNFFDKSKDWFNTGIIGLRLDVPIFNSGSKLFKVQQSQIELKQAQNNLRKVSQGLLLQFSKTQSELKSAYLNYENNNNNMTLAKEIFDITIEKYKEGLSTNLELIQIHNQYLTAQSVYFKSLSDMLNSKNALDRLLNNY